MEEKKGISREQFLADINRYVEIPITLEQETRLLNEINRLEEKKEDKVFLTTLKNETLKRIRELRAKQ